MRGIQANQQPLRITAGCNDASKLSKSMSEATSLARRDLKRDLAAPLWQLCKYFVQTLCYQLNAGVYACAEMRTGMKDKKRQSELIGSFQLCFKSLSRFLENVVIVCRQINQVAGV